MPVSSGGGGVTPLNVVIRISTNGVGAATSGMQNVTAASKKMGSSLQAGVITTRTLGDAMRMTSSLMKYTVAGAFMAMGQSAVQAFRNFELSFSRIKGLVGLGSDAVREMQAEVLKLATETTRGPEELADALYYVTSAGIKDANTAMSVLEVSARAAAAGLGETNTVADAVTSTLNAYGIENISAAKATDVLVATVREGKAEADTFAPALGKVLPVAAAFGASFEDVSAAIAALSRSGMTAGTSAIYVRQTLSQLLKPSKQAQEALYAVGTSAEEIRQNVREKGLFEALQILSAQLGGVDEGAAQFAKVFGNVRALTAVLSLVGPAAEENKVIFDRLRNSTGDLDDAFTAYSDTVDAQFNRAFAAQRVALVELGKSIKPIVTDLLGLAQVASNVFKAIATFDGGGFVRTIAVLAISVTAMAAALKTGSALVRLFSNLAIVLTGGTLKWDALNKKIVATNISQQANNATTNATTVAQTAAGTASGFFATQLQRLGIAITFVQRAMGFLSVILAVASAAYMIFAMRGKKAKQEQDDLATSIQKVNDVLDETVKYGKSTIKLGVEVDYTETETSTAAERLEKQILEQSPDFFKNINAIYQSQGEQAGNLFVIGLLNSQFGGVTGAARDALIELFSTKFLINPAEMAAAIVPTVTGSAVNDAVINNATIIAAAQNEAIADAMSGTGINEFAKALAGNVGIGNQLGADMRKGVAAFGAGFTDDINENAGNITSLVVAMRQLDAQAALTSDTADIILTNAFKNVNEEYKLFGIENGNLKNALMESRNEMALQAIVIKTTGKSENEAEMAIHEMRKELSKVPDDSYENVNAFRILSKTLGPVSKIIENTGTSANDASSEFESLVSSVRAVEEQYDQAQDTLKRYEKAQRAILGLTLDIEEAQMDYANQVNDTAEAAAESGGSFSKNTEQGRKAREELVKSAQAVFDLANAYQAAGRSKEAGYVFSKGMQQMVAAISQVSGTAGGLEAINVLESLGFTEETWKNGILASEEVTGDSATQLGLNLTTGIATGITQGQPNLNAALIAALNNVVITGKEFIDSDSPSKLTANVIGKPMAQGVSVGFTKEARSGRFKGALSKSLDNAITQLYKTGNRNSISRYLSSFLEKKKNVETPAQDFVRATIDRMKDIIGSLGDYIKAQLNFRNAQSDLAKLINMQRSYDAQRKRSAREVQYAETRFGGDGGAQVTGYEQAQIDELQLEFERVSRDYAMGRATYIDLVDAEIALFEARAAASEVNDDVIGAQNDFIDKTVQQENRTLELSGAIVSVQEAYLDQQEAAAELYMNHKELNQVYTALAEATGIASGKIVIGTKDLSTLGTEVSTLGGYSSTVGGYMSTLGNNISVAGQQFNSNFFGDGGIFSAITKTGADVKTLTTNIGADFTNLSRGLLNTDSQMYRDLNALGPAIFNAIRTGAQESLDKSPLNLAVSVNASVKGGKVSVDFPFNFDTPIMGPVRGGGGSTVTKRAVGGPVDDMTPYIVGERGPELFVPKVSGTIVTNSALERYSRTRTSSPSSAAAQSANNIVVTVNNPVPQAAEDSITRRMKVLANSGLFG